jgi:hypothetical protein
MYKNYGEILNGDTTCYVSFDTISNVLSIRLIFEGDTAFAPRPGEYIPSYLAKGFYTCKLSLMPVFLDSLMQKRYGYLDTEILPD